MSDWKSRATAVSSDETVDWKSRAMPVQEEPGLLSRAGSAVIDGLRKLDSVTGAPTRAAIAKLQEDMTDLGGAAHAFKDQFAEDPSKAPTGKQIAERAGLDGTTPMSERFPSLYTEEKGFTPDFKMKKGGFLDPTPAGAAGLLIDAGADPLTYVPPTAVAKVVGAGTRAAETAAMRGAQGLRKAAERLAERATGATAHQIEQFAPGAGRELLDRGIVRAGSAPAGVAKRAGALVDAANGEIDASLSALDNQGARLSRDQVLADLHAQISVMKGDPSKAGVVRKLEGIINDVAAGPADMSLTEAEGIKRNFQAQSNYNKPLTTGANKTAASAYRQGVEDVATAADPSIAEKFTEAKKTYGLTAPIEEAAAARAAQSRAATIGGLRDAAAAGAGAVMSPGGSWEDRLKGAAGGLLLRRIVAPRIASTVAVAADKAGKLLERAGAGTVSRAVQTPLAKPALMGAEEAARLHPGAPVPVMADKREEKTPEIVMRKLSVDPRGKRFLPAVQKAAERGKDAFSVTNYMLSQQHPEYRELLEGKDVEGRDEE